MTFDDGPSDIRTPPLLDLLKRYGVKATFFVLGQHVEAYPEIAQRITDEGHLIGNHSYDHPKLYLKTPRFIRGQIERTDSLIRQAGAQEIKYVRPPYCVKMIILPIILKSMDKKLVTYSYDPMAQYNRDFNGVTVADQIIENASPGVIVCLHDGRQDHPEEFVKAVEKIIIALREMGYAFVTVDYTEGLQH